MARLLSTGRTALLMSFLLFFCVPFGASLSYDEQTLTVLPPVYPYVVAQQILNLISRVPTGFQVATEQSFGSDNTTSCNWTDPKGQEQYSLRDQFLLGVRSFQLDVHYIQTDGPTLDPSFFRVCRSITSQVDVGSFCNGSQNAAFGIDVTPQQCQADQVETSFGIHAGCPADAPLLYDVLQAFAEWVDEFPGMITIRISDFTSGDFLLPGTNATAVAALYNSIINATIGSVVYSPIPGVNYKIFFNWPTFATILLQEKNFLLFR